MSSNTMLAAVLYGKEDVRLEEVPKPAVGPGEVRVHIAAALTCGTDLKVYRRGFHARMIQPPAVFGHEFAGVIDAVGDGVAQWEVGQRVVAANSAPCHTCFYCLRGRPQLCEDLLFVNGAYAEYITLPKRLVDCNLLPVPGHLPFTHAAMTEPLACVVNGFRDTGIREGDTVVVLGVGAIGLMFVRLCALSGAEVIAVGRGRNRLEAAGRLGANLLLSGSETDDIVQAVRDAAHNGRGPDKVIECVGQPATWEQAIAMGRKGAVINLFGGCPKDTFAALDTGRMHYDELTIKGTFHHTPETFREALRLIASGEVDAEQFISGTAPLHELPAVLRSLYLGSSIIKVAIAPAAAYTK